MRIRIFPSTTANGLLLLVFVLLLSCGAMPKHMAQSAPASPSMASAEMAAGKVASDETTSSKTVATWKRSTLASNTTRLMVGDRESLPLRAVQSQVRVDGFRARIVLDYLFQNDRDRTLEGNFQIRLPNEASPYFFAFGEVANQPTQIAASPELFQASEVRKMGDEPTQIMAARARSWTQPKEARIVPKEKAAQAYTATVQQRVDPALLEWSGAGVFSARVFPLQPKKLYRIVIGYDANLTAAGEDLQYQFDLPTGTEDRTVDLSIAELPGIKLEVSPTLPLTKEVGRLFARVDRPTAPTITLRLKDTGLVLLKGKDPSGTPYFGATFRPQLPASGAVQSAEEAVFLVDTSLSSNPDRFNIWLKLLKATLDNNRPSLQRFAVLFFNVEFSWWRQAFVQNTPENVRELLDYASRLSLEGATDLGSALSEAANPRWQKTRTKRADLFLLSDGAPTWGDAEPQLLAKTLREQGAALFAYNTGIEGTDTALLDLLARESGGAVFSLAGEAEVDKASTAHRARPVRLLSIEAPGVSDILLAGRPKALFPGQKLTVAGRGTLPAESEITLKLERDGSPFVLRTKVGAGVESELATRVYGQMAVQQLEELGDPTESIARSYAVHFRVIGRTCSLLMLESERDYQRFNIRPEGDKIVVENQPAGPAVDRVLAVLGTSLGDPKAALLSWLHKLEQTPGVMLRNPAGLTQAVQKMPNESFTLATRPLLCKALERSQLPPTYSSLLPKRSLDYNIVVDESNRRLKQYGAGDALKALSTLVEQNPGDSVLARDVGYSALEWGLADHAYYLFRRVAKSRPYEPQNYRAMAQALASLRKADLALIFFEIGLHGNFESRFGEFRRILSVDYLRFLRRIASGELQTSVPEYANSRLEALSRDVGIQSAELVIMITWNTDGTDVDLHVTEPSGEECMYSHRQTASGGRLTQDVTQGYGPEMYVLPQTSRGEYLVRAHYFASDRQRMSARTKVYATIFENWGTNRERVTEKVIPLEVGKEWHELLRILRTDQALQIAR